MEELHCRHHVADYTSSQDLVCVRIDADPVKILALKHVDYPIRGVCKSENSVRREEASGTKHKSTESVRRAHLSAISRRRCATAASNGIRLSQLIINRHYDSVSVRANLQVNLEDTSVFVFVSRFLPFSLVLFRALCAFSS